MRIDQIELTGSLSISASLATNPLVVNNNYLFVSNTGNVGIGTNNPTSKLVVTGSVSVRGSMVATSLVGSLTGSVKLPTIAQGTSETNIVLVDESGGLVYRSNLSLTGAQGSQGALGSQGTTGTNGAQGSQGAQGSTGVTGLIASVVLDFPQTNQAQFSTLTTTVTGAEIGDIVLLGVPNGAMQSNMSYTSWVSSANTVSVMLVNNSHQSSANPPPSTFKIFVIK
jgi:hypothetical protein